MKIKTFAVNLKSRPDRKSHILNEFKSRSEFSFSIVEPISDDCGAKSLWITIQNILRNNIDESEFLLLCEDDHMFTKKYSQTFVVDCLEVAKENKADILLGGVSWFKDAIQISKDIFWVNEFSGLQFTIIFRRFFDVILNADFMEGDAADYKISALSQNKLLIFPFVSIQKEFGYSDVTPKNNTSGRVTKIFNGSSEKLMHLKKVADFYGKFTDI
jgi:hypothetical protein